MAEPIRPSLFTHLIAPIAGASVLFILAYGTSFDFGLASFLFELQDGTWALQHHWLTETVLHHSVRAINEILVLGLLGYWAWRHVAIRERSKNQRALGVLLLSLMMSFASVAVLKRLLPMECPWDLLQFGGSSEFWGLFDTRPETMSPNQCFPAGHASIGFAWLALYYYWRELKPELATRGIVIGLTLGFLLGFVQQLRGAHFISHDIATAAVCWTASTVLYGLFQHARASELSFKSEPAFTSKRTTSTDLPLEPSKPVLFATSLESPDV